MQSEQIGQLAAALSKAQAEITGALKDTANPYFKSKYADLASCWDACRKQLTQNELAVIQTLSVNWDRDEPILVTTLAHSSGEWIRSELPIRAKDSSPQAQGSAITYARRYALAAIVGLAQVDDDGEAAQARHIKPNPVVIATINCAETIDELNAAYKGMTPDERKQHIDAFKARKAALELK